MIHIIIIDDHPMIVDGLKLLTAHVSNMKIISTFGTAASFYKSDWSPADLIILDIHLPDDSGINICKYIKSQNPSTKVIAFTNQMEYSIINQMMENGADGYLLKNVDSNTLISNINDVMDDDIVLSTEIKKTLFQQQLKKKKIPTLTRREKDLVILLSQGKTTIEIAEELFLSKYTIDTYRKNLLQKYDVKNTNELITLLLNEQLI